MENLIEILGHMLVIIAIAVSASVAAAWRQRLRRTTRHARLLYRTILIFSLFAMLANFLPLLAAITGGLSQESYAYDLEAACEFTSMIGQTIIVVALVKLKIMPGYNPTYNQRILAIGAHPDDLELACGGVLARLRDQGHLLHGLILSQGEQGGQGQVRQTEARNGARILGLDIITTLDFPDTRFPEMELEIMQAIESEITRFRPDVILTHSAHDLHQDHQTVHIATLRAARNVPTVLAYESPSATADFQPVLFVDVGEYLDVKMESIREHHDQAGKSYTAPHRVRGVAAFRGGQAKVRYAEGFEVVRALMDDLPGYTTVAPTTMRAPGYAHRLSPIGRHRPQNLPHLPDTLGGIA